MKVSAVLCTYALERYDDFAECVESLQSQTYDPLEILVIVDGTTSVYDRARDDFGGDDVITIHCNDHNRGLLESRNRGAELASGDVVAFIDDDAVADERWVEELVRAYEDQNAIAAGGKTDPEWVAGKPAFLPEEFYWLVAVTHRGFADGPGEVRNTFGTNISFQRDVFRELEGFQTEIGGRKGDNHLQGGETEICARMQAKYGRGVWYNPDAQVSHKVFEWRTRKPWLVKRAFWQGYSKYVMEALLPHSSDEESKFLGRLIRDFVPQRASRLVHSPSFSELFQFVMLGVLTGCVGAGYIYSLLKTR